MRVSYSKPIGNIVYSIYRLEKASYFAMWYGSVFVLGRSLLDLIEHIPLGCLCEIPEIFISGLLSSLKAY